MLVGKFEVVPSRPVPSAPPRSTRFYVLPAIIVFAVTMNIAIILFSRSMIANLHWMALWTVVVSVTVRLIMFYGDEFVTLPSLVHPYQAVQPGGGRTVGKGARSGAAL